MLSRTADNLYWLGRYLQRAENTARLLNVQAHLLLDMPRNIEFGWGALVDILSANKEFAALYPAVTEENVVRFLLLDPKYPGSVASSLAGARNILRVTRDRLPRELWERVNDLHLRLADGGERTIGRARRQEFLTRVTDGALLVYGMLLSNMSHDVGFCFLRLGTNIEQADMTTRIIDVRSANLIRPKSGEDLAPFQNIQWMGVLRSLSAQQMYQRHVRQRVRGASVLRYLLQDREFPRSVMFCLNLIAETLPLLPPSRACERTVQRTKALITDANIEKLVEAGLHDFMDEIQVGIAKLHDEISAAYFRL